MYVKLLGGIKEVYSETISVFRKPGTDELAQKAIFSTKGLCPNFITKATKLHSSRF
jgi:hypothetical protein